MKILGIDPGYGRVGWGVIESNGQKSTFIASDCIETSSNLEYYSRINHIYSEITAVIDKYKPDVVAMESIFFNTNAKTAILAAQARGVIALAAIQRGLQIFDYTPLQVKQALIGYGRADKKQIQTMLKFHLSLIVMPKLDDATDALAIALTHVYTNHRLR